MSSKELGSVAGGIHHNAVGIAIRRFTKRLQSDRTLLEKVSLVLKELEPRCRDLLRRAFEAANKTGDLTFAAYSCNNLNSNLLAAGDPLVEVQREAENGLEFAHKARFGHVINLITAQLGLVRTLRGSTPKFGFFDDGQFDEVRFERHLASEPVLALPECWYWARKLQARFFAGNYASAVDASLRAQRLLRVAASLFETAEYHFYGALSYAACCDDDQIVPYADSAPLSAKSLKNSTLKTTLRATSSGKQSMPRCTCGVPCC